MWYLQLKHTHMTTGLGMWYLQVKHTHDNNNPTKAHSPELCFARPDNERQKNRSHKDFSEGKQR